MNTGNQGFCVKFTGHCTDFLDPFDIGLSVTWPGMLNDFDMPAISVSDNTETNINKKVLCLQDYPAS